MTLDGRSKDATQGAAREARDEETDDELEDAVEGAAGGSGTVRAFVAVAEHAVRRLVADEQVAADLRSALRSETGSLGRLEAAQAVLARVLAHDRFACGERLRGSDLNALLGRNRLDLEDELRLVYELTLSGGRSWPAVAEAARGAPPSADGLPDTGRPVLLRALERLASSSRRAEAVRQSGPGDSFAVARATARARTSPLGVCRLALELAADSPGDTAELERWVDLLDDPFLRREFAPHLADLRARATVYLADRARRLGALAACDAWMSSVPALVAAGTGDPELRARVEELHAGRALAAGDRSAALAHLDRAEAILRESPAEADSWHHRRELRLKRAHVLAGDPSTRRDALDVLDVLDRELRETGRRDAVDPALERRLVLAAARVELDMARQSVAEEVAASIAERSSADQAEGLPARAAPEVLQDHATAWLRQADRLRRAHRRLVEADELLRHADEEQHAILAWCLGQSLLLDDRAAAAERLREAIARFRDLGDPARADRVSLDLMLCGLLAGVLGDDVTEEFRSEPLRLLRDLVRDAAARD